MNAIPWIIAIVAGTAAYVSWRRASLLDLRLEASQEELRQAHASLAEAQAKHEAELRELRLAGRRLAGEFRFLPTMTIAEAMELHPQVVEVLKSFDLAGCSNCAVSDVDTLEGACRSYGIDQNGLMRALSHLIEPDAAPATRPLDALIAQARGAPYN